MTAIPTPARPVSARAPFDRPSVVRLMLGHAATDFYQAAVPALVPYFIATFDIALAAVAAAGIGVAAFHPEATRAVSMFSGDRKGTGMSFFTIDGNIGFALAPMDPFSVPARSSFDIARDTGRA